MDQIARGLLEVKGTCPRQKGKQRTGLEGNINIWSGMTLQECPRVAENRDVWTAVARCFS